MVPPHGAGYRWFIVATQLGIFDEAAPALPEGMRYQRELISADEEAGLLAQLRPLPFKEFEFHGFLGKRRVVSYGWKYEFSSARINPADPLPEWLAPLRNKAGAFAGLEPRSLQQALVLEYSEGSGIGWHRDKPVFGDVIGVSLLAPCAFRLRRKVGEKFERINVTVEPRSAYLLRGPARHEWYHSIPGVKALRYAVTFRELRR